MAQWIKEPVLSLWWFLVQWVKGPALPRGSDSFPGLGTCIYRRHGKKRKEGRKEGREVDESTVCWETLTYLFKKTTEKEI